jgi:CRISPR/Cas system CMR-associated protein Cmr5 small subunit
MKSLDQIRAQSALAARQPVENALSQPGQGDRLKSFPLLILQCGLLAALVFAQERKPNSKEWKHPADHAIAQAITIHLQFKGVEITQAQNAGALVSELAAAGDERKLRLATVEAIRFLNYLKRFVA